LAVESRDVSQAVNKITVANKEIHDPFCFACTLGLLPCTSPQSQMSTAKWQNIAGSKKFFRPGPFLFFS
jgi:hypothetical protein